MCALPQKTALRLCCAGQNLECLPKLPTDQLFHRQMRNILIHAPPSQTSFVRAIEILKVLNV